MRGPDCIEADQHTRLCQNPSQCGRLCQHPSQRTGYGHRPSPQAQHTTDSQPASAPGPAARARQEDMPALRAALAAPAPAVPRACLQPRFEQLALFAAAHPDGGLAGALRAFAAGATLSAHYFLGDVEPMVKCARAPDHGRPGHLRNSPPRRDLRCCGLGKDQRLS